jgi:hypothetical protein
MELSVSTELILKKLNIMSSALYILMFLGVIVIFLRGDFFPWIGTDGFSVVESFTERGSSFPVSNE